MAVLLKGELPFCQAGLPLAGAKLTACSVKVTPEKKEQVLRPAPCNALVVAR